MATRSSYARTRSQTSRTPTNLNVSSTKSGTVKKKANVKSNEYEVDAIIDVAPGVGRRAGHRKFLVSWTGYDVQTWEPEENLPPSLVSAFDTARVDTATSSAVDTDVCLDERADANTNDNASVNDNACANPDANTDSNVNTDADTDADATAITVVDADVIANANADSSISTDADADADAAAITTGANADSNVNTDADADAHANAKASADPSINTDADVDADSTAITRADADASYSVNAITNADANASIDEDEAVFDFDVDADEYEVEEILDVTSETVKGVTNKKYLVAWAGYDDQTWEPEENLPAGMIEAFNNALKQSSSDADVAHSTQASTNIVAVNSTKRAGATKRKRVRTTSQSTDDWNVSGCNGTSSRNKTLKSSPPTEPNLKALVKRKPKPLANTAKRLNENGPICAACGEGPDGLGSFCVCCKKAMHHFCATDVCKSLGLKDANGEDIVEFANDVCYCSKECFNVRPGTIRASKRKRVRTSWGSSEPDDYDDDYHTGDNDDGDSDDDGEDNDELESKLKAKKLPTTVKPVKKPSTNKGRKKQVRTEAGEAPSVWPPRKPKKAPPKEKRVEEPRNRDPLIGRMVAFCADIEEWMPSRLYKEAKGLYLSGRAHRVKRHGRQSSDSDLFEVRWTVTNYQKKDYFHHITRAKVEEGIRNHATLSGGSLNNASWRHLCQVPDTEIMEGAEDIEDCVIFDGSSVVFISRQTLPDNFELVEQITNLDFQPSKRMQEPSDLFAHPDGSRETKLIKEKRKQFDSASSSFFAYLPLSFWRAVLNETNNYAAASSRGKDITLDELMRFLGIMFYVTIVDKGEYSNYWGEQVEDEIFGVTSRLGLDNLMTLKRFQYIRKNLCFRYDITRADLKKDPAARIRPLINMIKHTSLKYVVLGRNVAVDESSIACRSKFGRHMIVYNAKKPTGKFHFKIYACCCATTWLMVGFRLHCVSDMEDRLRDVIPADDAQNLDDRLQFSSSVRQIVLEVTRPIHNTHRVVNTDNWYTSVTLMLSLRDVGLYGRGTIRENSAHFPKAHMFAKKADEPRGSSLQGVSNTGQMIAASWMDGSAVNILSNADSSGMGEVTRMIGKERIVFPAPKCVAEYNKYMQGVDRLDQLRAKYSLADGHSMQKWHKKLALAFIDIARVNAYVTKCLRDDKPVRNQHRKFMIELASELITGKWKDTVKDEGMLFADDQLSTTSRSTTGSPKVPSTTASPTPACDFVLSLTRFPEATRGKRGCKVCMFEGRPWTMKTLYCANHNVCLCTKSYSLNQSLADVVCPHNEWSCWQKYHDYYLPNGVFNEHGRIKRSSKLFKSSKEVKARRSLDLGARHEANAGEPVSPTAAPRPEVNVHPSIVAVQTQASPISSNPPESPPTLVFSPFDGAMYDQEQQSPVRNSSIHDEANEVMTTAGGFRTNFQAYTSPREVSSAPASSTDFSGSLIIEL